MVVLIDSHIHAYEYGEEFISKYCNRNYMFLAVSDDYTSSLKTIGLSRKCRNVVPAIGLHPWEVSKESISELDKFASLVRYVRFLGEVGLDKKFVPNTWKLQLKVFNMFLELAETYGLGLSIHAAGAWREVIDLLKKRNIKVAIIHWYTGPTNLIEEITSLGFFIGVNPAIKIQKKMQDVVKVAPLEYLLTESDGPYDYRGLRLGPNLIKDAVFMIAKLKGIDVDLVFNTIYKNFSRVLSRVGLDLHDEGPDY